MESLKAIDGLRYAPFGRCIYCGRIEDLTNDHILPFGLSGTATLPAASCRTCAAITGSIEQKVLRGPMWAVRVYRALRSRTNHRDAPPRYPLTIVKGEEEVQIEVPIQDFPILLHFPVFSPPAVLTPEGYTHGIRMTGIDTISFGPKPEEAAKKLGATTIKLSQTSEPAAFARMIAKIGYAWAVAEGKLGALKGQPFVVPAILGKTDDIGRWVGTLTDAPEKHEGLLHYFALHEDREKNLLIAEVHLFSDSETPRYGVVLGELASPEKAA